MKTYIFTIVSCLLSLSTIAQVNQGGEPYSWNENYKSDANVAVYKTPALDLAKINVEDEKDEKEGVPPRFGFKHQVNLNLENSGTWIELPNGDKLWQLKVSCPEAKSINFTFNKFWLPENGKLFIFEEDKSHKIGAFSNLNNKGTRENLRGFATGLIYEENVIIEYYQPKDQQQAVININGIVHGYRYIADHWDELNNIGKTDDFQDSGGCQINVNCSPDGDDWQDEKKGVALIIVDGTRWCTGSLINNTCEDGDLLFLTAHHCLGGFANGEPKDAINNPDADDWSFVWNYEAPECETPGEEPPLFITNGATVLANSSTSDFALLRLSESPLELSPSQQVFFNGWNRGTNPSGGGAGIHHPSGDIKKISLYIQNPISNHSCSNVPNNTWSLIFEHPSGAFTTTEGGSSGSPLFDKNSRIIGQLWGGVRASDCSNGPTCNDPSDDLSFYGKFDVSWDNNTQIERQLKHWLNPCETDQTELDGGYLDLCFNLIIVNSPVNNNAIFQANNDILAFSTISGGAEVEMRAGQSVRLTPGFHSQSNSDFHAHIQPCVPQVIPAASKKEPETLENIRRNDILSSLSLYPNPTENVVNIEFYLKSDSEVSILITDLSGRQLANYANSHFGGNLFQTQLDLSDYSTGTYFVIFQTNDYKETKTLIVE